MKKIIFSAAILLSCLAIKANAQVSVSFGVNIGSQPAWGPVGYDRANYYYMPDIDTYYDVPTHQYVYYDNNVWVHRAYLPVRYRNYDLYHGYKVVINDRNPWLRHSVYRTQYASYRGRRDQVFIRDSRDARYAHYWRGDGGGRRVTYNRGGHFDNGNHGGRGPEFHGNRGGGHFDGGHDNHGGGRGGDHGEHGGGHGHH